MAPKKKKKKTGAGKHDWAVAGYDWVYKPYGDSVNVPTSVAGDKKYTYLLRFWRCFGEECQVRLDTLLDGMSTNKIHWSAIWGNEVIKEEHKMCKGCASAKHRRVDGDDDPELRYIQFEDFSNDKADLMNAQLYLKGVVADRALKLKALQAAHFKKHELACKAKSDETYQAIYRKDY